MRRLAFSLLGLLTLSLALTACSSEPPTGHKRGGQDKPRDISVSEDIWEPMAQAQGEWLIGQASIELQPGESMSNGQTRARFEALKMVMKRLAREEVPDTATYQQNEADINRVIINQGQNYIEERQLVAVERFRNNTWIGVQEKFKIDRDAVERALEDLRVIRTDRDQYKIVLALRKHGSLDPGELDTLRATIGDVFNNRNFYVYTFENLKSKILKKRNIAAADEKFDDRTEEFFRTFIDDPAFKDSGDLQGGYTLLAHYAKSMIAFSIPVLETGRETVSVVVKAEFQDLQSGRTISFDQQEATRLVPFDGGRRTAIFKLVRETAVTLSNRLVEKAHDWYDKQEKVFAERGQEVTVLFKGFDNAGYNAIARIVTATYSNRAEFGFNGNGDYFMKLKTTEPIVEFRNNLIDKLEEERTLRFEPPPPVSSGSTLVFFAK